MTLKKGDAVLFATASAICVATPAWAQQSGQVAGRPTSESSAVGEIVVTAQFRSENIMQTPL